MSIVVAAGPRAVVGFPAGVWRWVVSLFVLWLMARLVGVSVARSGAVASVVDETGVVQVTDVSVRRDAGFIIVSGTVRNTSGTLCPLLEVEATLVDSDQTPLARRSVLASPCDVDAGASGTFAIVLDEWPGGTRVALRVRYLSHAS